MKKTPSLFLLSAKTLVGMALKSVIMMICVYACIAVEFYFASRNQEIGLIIPLLLITFLPDILCDLLARGRITRHPFSTAVHGIGILVFCAIACVARFLSRHGVDGYDVYYPTYTGAVLIMAVLPLFFYADTKHEFDFNAKSARLAGVYSLLIHLCCRLFLYITLPELDPILLLLPAAATLVLLYFSHFKISLICLLDESTRKRNGISSRCPVCQTAFPLPRYKCDRCGKVHDDLLPGGDNGWYTHCSCKRRLPTTFLRGKGHGKAHLQAVCPTCGANVPDGGYHVDLSFPVIGGASAGKTCFIHQSINEVAALAPANGLTYENAMSAASGGEGIRRELDRGFVPSKTTDNHMQPVHFRLSRRRSKLKHLVALCDINGQAYADSVLLGGQIGFKYADGYILILDPLSISKFHHDAAKALFLPGPFKPCTQTPDEVVGIFLSTLENMLCISSADRIPADIAVVFTKCDFPGVEKKIGRTAVDAYRAAHKKASRLDAQNAVCRAFLSEYEETNLVNTLDTKFRTVQFFSVSSLGHVPSKDPFTTEDVEEPLLWMIEQRSPKLRFKKYWKGR